MTSSEVLAKGHIVGVLLEDHAGYGANAFVHDKLFESCRIHASNLFNSAFIDCTFLRCEFTSTEFGGCQFVRCQFLGCEIVSSGFVGARFEDCILASAGNEQRLSIKSCGFEHALFIAQKEILSFSNTRIADSSFRYATFSGIQFYEAEFLECSFGESNFIKCIINQIDLWENTCRGMAFLDTSIERLFTPLQKALGLIGIQDLIGHTQIILSHRHKDKKNVTDYTKHISEHLEFLEAKYIQPVRLIESINLILIKYKIDTQNELSLSSRENEDFKNIEQNIQNAIESCVSIDNPLIIPIPIPIPILDDITLCARLLHRSQKLSSSTLITLGRQVAFALSKGTPDSVSTAKCIHVLNEIGMQYFVDSYRITISHWRSDMHQEILGLFYSIKSISKNDELFLRRLENGSTKLSFESISTRSMFFCVALLLMLGLKVEYSSKPTGPTFSIEYSLAGTFIFHPSTGEVSISIPTTLKNASNELSAEDHDFARLVAKGIKDQLNVLDQLEGMSVLLQQVPVYEQPVFTAIRELAAQPGSWSTYPQLERQSVLAQLDHPQYNP